MGSLSGSVLFQQIRAARLMSMSRAEMASYDVSVTHVAPGFVESEIRLKDNSGMLKPGATDPIPKWLMLGADAAARTIVSVIAARKPKVVVSLHGKVLACASPDEPGRSRCLEPADIKSSRLDFLASVRKGLDCLGLPSRPLL